MPEGLGAGMSAWILALWFLPVVLAFGRGCYPRRCIAITIICALLSWTIVGWVFAFIWALESPARSCRC